MGASTHYPTITEAKEVAIIVDPLLRIVRIYCRILDVLFSWLKAKIIIAWGNAPGKIV